VYAIVDIETTGGHADSNGITEIAIYVYDGEKVVDQFVSLINPESYIPAFISGYTGITNEMVENAPIFREVAEQVFDLLKDNIFVAHNVNFDYSFIKHQLQQSGYDLNAQKLCTVRLSRKVFPGYKSYSLGNICGSLSIPISDRHRAAGDAKATVILFEKILRNDDGTVIKSFLKKGSKEYLLPPNLPKEQFDKLPQQTGVYYFHDQQGKIIYVGKAKNIKKRVGSHFGGNSTAKQKQDFLRNIHAITFIECATELMAFILESIEIKQHWPAFNRALKKLEFNFGIYDYQDRNDYIRLCIDRVRKNIVPLYTFKTQVEAINALQNLVSQYELCPKLCLINTSKEPCELESSCCHGACQMKEDAATYNQRIQQAIDLLTTQESYAIIDKGLYADERSCILVENGKFIGMGYMPVGTSMHDLDNVRSFIKLQKESFYIREILQSEALTSTAKRINFEYVPTLKPKAH
jgi:DNA polymerase-3 subunit epsilon